MKVNKTVLQFAVSVAFLAGAVQTSVAQSSNLGSIGQAVKTAAPYDTVYFGIYPQTLFYTVLEAVEYMPPRHPPGPFFIAKSDNEALNGGALTSTPSKAPRGQATIMNVEPLKWQLVKDDADGFLLITNNNIDVQAYSNSPLGGGWDGTWKESSLRDWLQTGFLGGQSHGATIPQVYKASLTSYSNGEYNDLIGTIYPTELTNATYATNDPWTPSGDAAQTPFFSAAEKNAIVTVSLTNPTYGGNPDNVPTQDAVFLPAADVVEAIYPNAQDRKSVNTRYVTSFENTAPAPEDDDWLTRSHSTAPFPGYVTQVSRGTGILEPEAAVTKKAIRPALYLNRDRVLMVSQSKSGVNTSFAAASFSPSSVLKLTLVDNTLPSLSVDTSDTSLKNGYIMINTGDKLKLDCNGGSGGTNSYISCLLEDNTGIRYYTKAETCTGSTVPQFQLDFTDVVSGAYTLKVFNEIVNLTNKPDYASAPVSFNVYISGITYNQPVINNDGEPLSDGFEERAYSDTVKLSSGDASTFSIVGGSLPAGLSLNTVTGRISGTPAAGTANPDLNPYSITVRAQNPGGSDEELFTFEIRKIVAPKIVTTQTSLEAVDSAQGYLSIPYEFQFKLDPNTGQPSVKFYITEGSVLPQGLTLDPDGRLHGTPTSVETQNFTICAETEGTYDYQSYTISILVYSASNLQEPKFVTQQLSGASWQVKENTPFTEVAVQITGSQFINVLYDPATFPTGMTFDPSTWKILGTPILGTARTDPYRLHLWAKNPATKPTASSGPDSVGIEYILDVLPADVPQFTTSSELPAAAQNQPYSAVGIETDVPAVLAMEGGFLPTGVTFAPAAAPANVAGTPTTSGLYTFKIKATNAEGSSSRTFTLTVQPPLPPPSIDAFTLPDGTVGEAYTGVTLTATNSPTTWTWTGVPAGLGLSLSNGGAVSGTPTAEGVYDITFQAANVFGSSSPRTGSITIRQSPLSVPPTLVNAVSDGIYGQAYYAKVYVFTRPDIEWTLEKGALPAGLTFEDGVISGTPTGQEGKFTVTVKASSAGNLFAPVTRELTIWIMAFTEEYRSRKVALPAFAGMTTDREPGVYYVKSGDDFTFVITPHDAGVVPEVTTGRMFAPDSTGVAVTPNGDGLSYTVVIREIHEDVLVSAIPSAIAPVEGTAGIWSAAGQLYISVTATAEARISDIVGRRVKTVSVEAGRTAVVPLAAGLYIVELDSGSVYKVFVR